MRQAAFYLMLLCSHASSLYAQSPPAGTNTVPLAGAAASSSNSSPDSPGANLAPAIPWRQNVFSIPFQVSPPAGSPNPPAEIQLYLSLDQGQSWRLASRVAPQAGKFAFRAPSDGEYWFAMRSLGANGLFLDNQALTPGLRVIVDTTAPKLEIRGQRGKSGEVELHWQIADAALDARTLKIEYQSAHDASWRALSIGALQPGQVPGSAIGSASFWNGQGVGAVSIRAEVTDIAGNRTVSQAKIALDEAAANALANVNPPPVANSPAPLNPAVAQQFPPGNPSPNGGQPQNNSPIQTQDPFRQQAGANPNAGPQGNERFNPLPPTGMNSNTPQANSVPNQGNASLPGWNTAGTANPGASPYGTGSAGNTSNVPPGSDDIFLNQPPTAQAWPADRVAQVPLEQTGPLSAQGERYFAQRTPAPPAYANQGLPQPNVQQPVYPPQENSGTPYQNVSQQRESLPGYAPPGAAPLPFELPRGAKLRMVAAKAFELQYDLSTLEPAAIAKVELWGTQDGGRSWSVFCEDADRKSPIPAEVKSEGIYGFSIVVHANSGQSSPTPQPGSQPEVWVGVDQTMPAGELLAADAGANDINIRWTSSDLYPAAKPVTLAYGATPQGPWTQITTGQASQGAYTWQPGRNVPELVFIQLQVIDEAGNLASFVSQQNVALPHHRPQGRILDVQPVGPVGPSAGNSGARYP